MPIKMPSIETHEYRTPTATNRDCPYSLGVMNLTREEANLIAAFIDREVRPQRSMMRPPAAPDPRGAPPRTLTREEVMMVEAQRADRLMSMSERVRRALAEPPISDVPKGNRFSGLDIE
jgi:hypothetical protein